MKSPEDSSEPRRFSGIDPGDIADNVDALISYIDTDERYRFVNKGYERRFGMRAEEIIGKRTSDFLEPEVYENAKPYFQMAFAGEAVTFEGLYQASDLNPQHSMVKLVPDMDSEGNVRGLFAVVSDVTELKSTEASLATLAAIVEASQDAIIRADLKHNITFWSNGAEHVYGYSAEEVLGRPISILMPPGPEELIQEIGERIESGETFSSPNGIGIRKDGTEIRVSMSVFPIRDAHGTVTGVAAVHQDVTAYQIANESRLELAAILEASNDAIIRVDMNRDIELWSKGAERIYGYSAAEMMGRSIATLMRSERVHLMTEGMVKVEDGESLNIPDAVVVDKAGTELRVSISVFPIRDVKETIVGSAQVHQNVTAYQNALESRLELAAVVEASSDAIIRIGLDRTIEFWSKGAETLYGYSSEETVGQPIMSVMRSDRVAGLDETFTRLKKGETLNMPDAVGIRKDGQEIRVSISAFPLRDVTGRVIGLASVHRDVTAIESRLELAAIVEASSDAIIRTTLDGLIQFWSPGAERIYGYSAHEIVGRSILILQDEPDAKMEGMGPRLRAGESASSTETVTVDSAGRHIHVSVSVFPIKDASGEVVGAASVHRDITAQKQAEERSQHSQRLESIGTLAGGIAHDFNNILTVIEGYCSLINSQLKSDKSAQTGLTAIQDAAERAATLTRQLLAFSRQQHIESQVLSLNKLAGELAFVLRRTLGDDVEVVTNLESNWMVKGDSAQLEQIILNLALNARHAMPSGGILRLETADVVLNSDAGMAKGGNTLEPQEIVPGSYVRLLVADNGVGIEADILPSVFEPFFTTKGQGEGTGLGLSAVYGAVTQMGGAVSVESTPGEGTVFAVFLPMVDEMPTDKDSEPVKEAIPGQATILIVEDNVEVLKLTSTILTMAGYSVLQAESPQTALEQHLGTPLDLILTDVMMPGMNGPDFIQTWQKTMPDTRVLFMSGFSDDSFPIDRVPSDQLLGKPFSAPTLLKRIAEALRV
jgi:two-component system cell cycle sensor histidine kinase/response regulator CckA